VLGVQPGRQAVQKAALDLGAPEAAVGLAADAPIRARQSLTAAAVARFVADSALIRSADRRTGRHGQRRRLAARVRVSVLGGVRIARAVAGTLGDGGSVRSCCLPVRTPIEGLAISNGCGPVWRWWPRRWPTSSAHVGSG
jgi:hypothetical protein